MSETTNALDVALGVDLDDRRTVAAIEDANAHMNLISSLVHQRAAHDLSQVDVAERMETTQSRVSNFECLGADPRLSTVFRYARAVNARIRYVVRSELIGWEEANIDHVNIKQTHDSSEDSTDNNVTYSSFESTLLAPHATVSAQ